jgi:hypothetical protein
MRQGPVVKADKSHRGLHDVLMSRTKEPLLGILVTEGPGLWSRFPAGVADASVDFELLPLALKAAKPLLRQPRGAREGSQEWIALRITLEHLVYFLARLQLFLAGALADAYAHHFDLPRGQRFGWRPNGSTGSLSPTQMHRRWQRLMKKRVAEGDSANEHRLIADSLMFVGSAHHQCSKLLLLLLSGRL